MTKQLSTSHPWWAPYVFMAPFVLIFCTFMLYPLLQSIVLAMQQTFGPRDQPHDELTPIQFSAVALPPVE